LANSDHWLRCRIGSSRVVHSCAWAPRTQHHQCAYQLADALCQTSLLLRDPGDAVVQDLAAIRSATAARVSEFGRLYVRAADATKAW
jgi:hypothetical protein